MRAYNFGLYGRRRPARTAVRTAVPCTLLIRPPWPGAATRDENRVGPLPSPRPRPPHHPRTPRGMTRAIFVSVEGSLRGTSCRRENRAIPSQAGLFSGQDEAAGSSPARPTAVALSWGNARRLYLSIGVAS